MRLQVGEHDGGGAREGERVRWQVDEPGGGGGGGGG